MTFCSIHSVAFGGDGVGKIEAKVCFVPNTLPDEIVEVKICEQKRNFARGELLRIIRPNSERVTPPCPYFLYCGGCQLQHASYSLQLELKKRFLEDSLTRIAHLPYPVPQVRASTDIFGYRRHITLKIQQINNSFSLGFTTKNGSHLPINSCLLFRPSTDPVLIFLQKLISNLDPNLPLANSTVKIVKTSEDHYLIFCSLKRTIPRIDLSKLQDALTNYPSLDGWIIQTPEEAYTFGTTMASFTHRGITCFYSPLGFVQNHPEQAGLLYDWIVEKNKKFQKIVDLYCGIGASSLLLAREVQEVIGVELNPASVEMANQNASSNQINNIEFICSDVETAIPALITSKTPNAIVVNPPKIGLSESVLKILAKYRLPITYISCNPPTLARDLAYLAKEGFIIKELQAFDMFPQTTHLETAVFLEYTDSRKST